MGGVAFLFAGQGAQHVGMGRDLYETYPAFRAVLDSAPVDFDLKQPCFDGPEDRLNDTRYTQPCMVAFAAGVTAVLKENGVKAEYLAGLSLGEYSALQAAGVFTAKQAIELTAFRGKAMAEAAAACEVHIQAAVNQQVGIDRRGRGNRRIISMAGSDAGSKMFSSRRSRRRDRDDARGCDRGPDPERHQADAGLLGGR